MIEVKFTIDVVMSVEDADEDWIKRLAFDARPEGGDGDPRWAAVSSYDIQSAVPSLAFNAIGSVSDAIEAVVPRAKVTDIGITTILPGGPEPFL